MRHLIHAAIRALASVSRTTGRGLGERARRQAGKRPGPASLRAAATGVLTECGYEPRDDGAEITLVNCPFHALAQDYTDLVCGMNLELIGGLVETLEHPTLEADLAATVLRTTDRTRTINRPVIDKEER